MSFPILSLLIATPLAGACAVRFVVPPERARLAAALIVLLTLSLALIAAVGLYLGLLGDRISELGVDLGSLGLDALGDRPLLAMDGLSAPLVPLTALLAAAVIIAAPRTLLDRSGILAVLLITGATCGLLLAQNVVLLALFWVGAALPGFWRITRMDDSTVRTRLARTYGTLFLGGSVPLLVVAVLLGKYGLDADLAAPLDIAELAAMGVPAGKQSLLFALVLITVAARMALVPFHSWFPIFAERGPIGVTVLLIGVHTGVYVIARLVIPLLPHACAGGGMQVIAALAVTSSLLGALLALVQHDLRRMIGFLAITQSGFVMIGIASLDQQSISGALIQSIGVGVATSALFLMVRFLEARTGTTDVRHLGGLVTRAPRAASVFFLFGVASVGMPGFVGFVGEDLLIHGALHAHPVIAGLMLVATALGAITFFRAYTRTFLGRAANRPRTAGPLPIEDLLPRERYVSLALISVLFAGGVLPQPLIDLRQETVDRLVAVAGHPADDVADDGVSPGAGAR